MNERKIDFKSFYPNLIIFIGPKQNDTLLSKIKKSFNEFNYGPVFTEMGTAYKHELGRELSTCRVMQGSVTPICLAHGEGFRPCDAELQAVEKLMKKLCEACYVIQANPDFFTKKKVPPFALNADPSDSHVYRVVFLKKNSRGIPFPQEVSGAIDYVENFDNLLDYIKAHTKSGSKADLFILNVLKSDRAAIRQVCQTNGFSMQNLVGCSDMGLYAYRVISTYLILQELLEAGGKTVKYKLIGPSDQFGKNDEKVSSLEESGSADDEEIVINQWIADHLVVMEVVTESNELELPKEIIWRSVRDCPDTQEFIIEKRRNNAAMIFAEAMIDRKVVGRARGFNERDVKTAAAESAMENLMKNCYYIQAKKSYFGSSHELPQFLKQPNPIVTTQVYRIAEKTGAPFNTILKQFKSSWQEDLYFLQNFTYEERNEIHNLANKMNLMVRWIGRDKWLCVYKRRKPKEVLMELMATRSKENDKYKLIIPPAKRYQSEDDSTQNWNNERMPHNAEGLNQPMNRGRDTYKSSEVLSTQAAQSTSQYQTPYDDYCVPSQSCPQGGKTSGEGNTETPNWVMKFIQSSKSKPLKSPKYKKGRSTEPQRHKDDVYSRYKFPPPRSYPPPFCTSSLNSQGGPNSNPPSVFTSSVNSCRTDHSQDQNTNRNTAEPYERKSDLRLNNSEKKGLDHKATLSERLTHLLDEYHKTGIQDLTGLGGDKSWNQGNDKQSFSQDPDGNQESESSKKFKFDSQLSTDSHCSKNNSSVERLNSREEEQSSYNYLKGQTGSICNQRPTTWDLNIGNRAMEGQSGIDKNFQSSASKYSNLEEGYSSKNQFHKIFDCKVNTIEHRNTYIQGSSLKEDESSKETSQLFESKPESTYYNTPLWNNNIKQKYDQRVNTSTEGKPNFSNLFDYDGSQEVNPQGPARPTRPSRPPPSWKKNKQSRGHSFSKLAKYGKNKGRRGPY